MVRVRFRSVCIAATMVATSVLSGITNPAEARRFTPRERAVAAAGYIARAQQTGGSFEQSFSPVGTASDAVLSLVAARRGPDEIDDALEFIEANLADADANIGLKAKIVMAVVAGGLDPRAFGGRDLVQELQSALQSNGQYGAHTAQSGDGEVFNQALVLLALAASGEGLAAESAFSWLRNAQCRDGGWQFDDPSGANDDEHCVSGQDDFFRSDTDTTSYATQALYAAADTRIPEFNPFVFFERNRDPIKGGWGYDASFPLTSANSTALVIQAYAAAESRPPAGTRQALKALQYRLCGTNSGAFAATYEKKGKRYVRTEPNVPATIGAVLGMLRRPLPIAARTVTKEAPRAKRCS